ncbi:MAG: hypothetical protein VX899_10015 [Myxococcota bacterium]|nr:hypothetical protein [Myxococcota bacterium]
MRRALIATFALLGTASACVTTDACDDYVDYMCDCHPEADCAELRTIHQDAQGEELTDCAVALQEQKTEDTEAGDECEAGDTGVAAL